MREKIRDKTILKRHLFDIPVCQGVTRHLHAQNIVYKYIFPFLFFLFIKYIHTHMYIAHSKKGKQKDTIENRMIDLWTLYRVKKKKYIDNQLRVKFVNNNENEKKKFNSNSLKYVQMLIKKIKNKIQNTPMTLEKFCNFPIKLNIKENKKKISKHLL